MTSAQTAADGAQRDVKVWTDRLNDAQGDLERAQKQGRQANDRAQRAGRTAAGEFGGLAGEAQEPAMVGGGAGPAGAPVIPITVPAGVAARGFGYPFGPNGGLAGNPFAKPGSPGNPFSITPASVLAGKVAAAERQREQAAEDSAAKERRGALLETAALAAATAGLAIVDVAQLGLDPATDGATAATAAATAARAGRVVSGAKAAGEGAEWLRAARAGRAFDAERSSAYTYNQVYVRQPESGYYRLDSYNSAPGEIVSRKLTQFGEVEEKTGVSYVRELANKYPPNTRVADVPSTPTELRGTPTELRGTRLKGRMLLEVPVQKGPIPQSVLNEATRLGIRDQGRHRPRLQSRSMTTISYCDRWNDLLRAPIDPLSEDEARARHERGTKYYTAVIGDLEHPEALVMVSLDGDMEGMVDVDFLDAEARPHLRYQFDQREGRLFFSHASIKGYGEGRAVQTYEHYRFEPDGHVWGLREEQGVRDTWRQWADVADNWEDVPAFGDYTGVLRRERDIKFLDGPPAQVDTAS